MADREAQRPDKAYIFELLEQRRTVLAPMHQAMREADAWLHAHEDPTPPEVLRALRRGFPDNWTARDFDIQPYAYIECNRAINSITTAEVPQVTHELAPWFKQKHEKTAEDDEKAVQLAAQSILRRVVTRSGRNPVLDAQWQQMALGLACLYYPLDYDALGDPPDHGRGTLEEQEAWETYERKRAEALPWRVESLHPTWIFFDLDCDPPRDIIIERPVSLAAMQRQYPDKDFGGEGEQKTAKYVEYISERYYACYVNQVPVTPNADSEGVAENYRGFIWAELIWSGMGKLDAVGAVERQGVGLVTRGINNYRSRTWNRNWTKLIKRSYIPKLIGQDTTGGEEEAMRQTQGIDPGEPGVVALGTTNLRWLETPNIPPALLADLDADEKEAEAYAGPGVLSGEFRSEPASKQSARTELARGPYRTPKANMEQGIANMLGKMNLDLLHEPDLAHGYRATWREGKGPDVRQYAVYLKPQQIHPEASGLSVDLSPLTPQDKAFLTEDAIAKRDAQLISTERAMKDGAEIEDPEREMARIVAEKYMQSDNFLLRFDAYAGAYLDRKFGPPPMPAMAGMPPAAGGGGGFQPPVVQPPLPPNVPVQPQAPLGSGQEAQQQAAAMFNLPRDIVAAGRY